MGSGSRLKQLCRLNFLRDVCVPGWKKPHANTMCSSSLAPNPSVSLLISLSKSASSLSVFSFAFVVLGVWNELGELDGDELEIRSGIWVQETYKLVVSLECSWLDDAYHYLSWPLLESYHQAKSPTGSVGNDEELSGMHNVRLYTYKELKVATQDFSLANKIGEGGFGSVYKGRLRNGKLAAIKVLSAQSRQGLKEFLAETKVISVIEHENLVQLYGCCVENNHRILVYNYLENNSLAQTLLGRGSSSLQFDWRSRSRICIGIARGLAFLHEDVQPYIIHRDIKASNILLDRDLTPKISDFGLARLVPANMSHISTGVAGTIGYLAPEYAIRGQVTRKSDIYSFGVLLVEIVSGRCNKNTKLPIGEQYLLETAWNLYEQGELVLLVDMSLNGDFDAEEACKYISSELEYACLSEKFIKDSNP
ncbi:Cold-responsive protein kinase 1, partial [Cucurbita argyrosperma subsp. argyrosperma]